MSNWDPCGEKLVPDEYRAQLADEYEESEVETEREPDGPGPVWIIGLSILLWFGVGLYYYLR